MEKVMVIGGGTMGLDIAQVFAKKDFDVIVHDLNEKIINNSISRLNKTLDKLITKNKLDEAGKEALTSKITFTTDINMASDVDLVIEAVVESIDIKKNVFSELDSICKSDTILASNTSSISITAIAAATKRADKFIGIHFFNPAAIMKLVEVIRGANTSEETFNTVYALIKEIEKEPVEVNEAPGFVVNKLLIPMINEAADLLYTGVALAADIDKAMQLGANHPIGPLALGDLIGLDVCLAIMDTLYSETHNPKYASSLLLRKLVRSGHLGRKSGKGFFDYSK